MDQLNRSSVSQIFDKIFNPRNVFYKDHVFFECYDIILIYALNMDQIIKPNYENFYLFEFNTETNIITYQIKLNDFLQYKKTLNF